MKRLQISSHFLCNKLNKAKTNFYLRAYMHCCGCEKK